MKVSRLSARAQTTFVLLLLTFLSIAVTARADDDEPDDYDVKARVVRISLITGEASLKRNGNKDWERARVNYPLVEGDTVATDRDSRLEIQFDARNFVRLAPNTVLRIVSLRDQGTAVGVVEGTAIARLAKFDHGREFFEIDGPRTTLAAEKTGVYRVDVPREGRVRLTVRDGGTARIYSDTSGFTLRDGRSAELIVTGDTAGDWDLLAAAAPDSMDAWADERDRYLAQQMRPESKYYDEDVWGAEELASYGEWIDSQDYGWIWRPHASVLNVYADWAPYRYGHWTWCPPYGWTWVGYEPWGWAPYHYGRWVFYNNYWAWVPRSQYYKKRSWWRPALVAFVSFDFSFGNNVCWYPLSYHQRDPHSRYYRRHDRNPGYGGGGRDGRGGRGRDDADAPYKNWRGVTRVPRTDFGNGSLGRPVDEPVARRVLESEPQLENLPQRAPNLAGARPAIPEIIERPTGAAQRAPGVELDEELRRSRIYHGRQPRQTPPPQQSAPQQSAPPSAPAPVETSSPEPRAMERPAPVRVVRPSMPDDGEKRVRGQQRIERPEPRMEPRSEPRSVSPRSEPRSEAPRSEPTPRSESPRSESPRSEPAPRSEPPRSESPRSEPAPRSESPRSEPRVESPRSSDSPKSEGPKRPDNR
ncbi:MAG TPA: DUF6600 domain-containing protein [Pyrinomonadaceae bacterium]|nr:DUF6600 domain-containing protein [Pyrinomonadaceae bacterium]